MASFLGVLDLLLGLVDGRGEVAVPDAELDRDVALVVLTVDVRRPGDVRVDLGQLPERDPGPGLAVGSPGVSTGMRLMTVGVVAEVDRQAEDDVVELLPLDHLRERLAADGHLDGRLDVGDVHAVAGAGLAVDPDLQVGLAEDVEQARRSRSPGPTSRRSTFTTLLTGVLQGLQVGAEQLDRVRPLDAREGLLDVVADELREVEVDAGELARTSSSARRSISSRVMPASPSVPSSAATAPSA